MTIPTEMRLPYASSIPHAWKAVPLKHLATSTNGYAFKPGDWKDNGVPIIRIENLNGSENYNYSDLQLSDRYQVTSEDLLYSWSGNPGTSFGPFRWQKAGRYYLNQHIFKLGVYGCDLNWLYWALKAATHWIERELTSGMIGMVHVTKEELGNVPLPIPPIDEQRRIADFLDAETSHISRIIAVRERQLELVGERVRSLRDHLIDALYEECETVPMRRLSDHIEQGASPQCDNSPASPGEWAVLKLSSVKSGVFAPQEHKLLKEGGEALQRHEVKNGDLLVTRANTPDLVGDIAIVRDCPPMRLLPDLIYRLTPSPTISAEYLSEVALGGRIRSLVKAEARGSSQSMVKLRGEDILSWPIPAASEEQQDDLSRRMQVAREKSQRLSVALSSQIRIFNERRRALITAAVTGQFDVSTASGRGVGV